MSRRMVILGAAFGAVLCGAAAFGWLHVRSQQPVVSFTPDRDAAAAPSAFLSEFTNGVAWVNGADCAAVECAVEAGGVYALWGNGFGPRNGTMQDGVPAPVAGGLGPIEVPPGPASCWGASRPGSPG